ncbi:MAG: hypothetical protein ACI3ZP_11665 [Candidatus Cryptobacteroides sp.]
MQELWKPALKHAGIILATILIFSCPDLYAHYITTLHDDTIFYSDEACTRIAEKGITYGNSFWIDDVPEGDVIGFEFAGQKVYVPRSEVRITLEGAGYDDDPEEESSSKISSGSAVSGSVPAGLRKLLKWLIIIGTVLLFLGYAMSIPEKKTLKKPVWRKILVALAGLDLLYVLLPGAFSNFGSSSIFDLEILVAVQCLAVYLMFKHDRNNRKAVMLFIAVVLFGAVVCISKVGIKGIFTSLIGGLLNLAVGVVVLIALYGIYNDGFDSSGSSSDSGDEEPRKRNTTDPGCFNCAFRSSSSQLCTKFNHPTNSTDHCGSHIWE